jgi:DNA repair protein RecO (recombination protein O)
MNSRLRLGSEPFTWSLARLYYNPVKRSYKVTELEIHSSFPGLQERVSRLATASLWAEVTQKSYGAGELGGGLFQLFLEALQALEAADEQREPYVGIQFLWRFLGMAGYQPDTGSCDRCGAPLSSARAAEYDPAGRGFLCAACASGQGTAVPAGCLRYLEATQALPLEQALGVTLEAGSRGVLAALLPQVVQDVIEGELASLRLAGYAR